MSIIVSELDARESGPQALTEADRAYYASLYNPPAHISPISVHTQDRFQRFEATGRPATVWERQCIDHDITSTSANQATIWVSPSSFDKLRLSRPLDAEHQNADGYLADGCRHCTGTFVFQTQNHSARILIGKPTVKKYKAISYVWGDTTPLLIQCRCFQKKIFIPMSTPERFSTLLSLASTATEYDGVWLDVLSIDQDSHSDRQVLLGQMGEIYKSAESTLVLLTRNDKKIFDCIKMVREAALMQDIMDVFKAERRGSDDIPDWHLDIMDIFMRNLETMRISYKSGTYFQRAWTFQEWSLARDLDIACECSSSTFEHFSLLPKVKSSIIRAAVRLVISAMTLTSSKFQEILPQADAPAFLEDIKRLFPHEDIFCSDDEVDWNELIVDSRSPVTGLNHLLGLRLADQNPPSNESSFRSRLHFALNTFNSSKRQARFEADLIACWASMCNLQYDYQRGDTFLMAQTKILCAIRDRGIQIFNFQANVPGMTAEMDADFLSYSFSQPFTHTTYQASSLGAPIFTGVTDLAHHLRQSVHSKKAPRLEGQGVELWPIPGPKIEKTIPMAQIEHVAEELARIQTGYWKQSLIVSFRDVRTITKNTLQSLPFIDLQDKSLVVLSFAEANLEQEPETDLEVERRNLEDIANDMNYILSKDLLDRPFIPYTADTVPTITQAQNVECLKYAWAICETASIISYTYVARESLNGTLVFVHTDPHSEDTKVLAYLTGVDMMSGAYLLPVDSNGEMDVTLRAPQRSDVQMGARGGFASTADRQCVALFEWPEPQVKMMAF